MIAVQFNDSKFVAEIATLSSRIQRPRALAAVLGREANNRLRVHFRRKQNAEPNKLGGKRTNFWRAVANSVQSPIIAADGLTIRVGINHPAIAQKYYGGVITAKRAKALTIPVSQEAYGRTAETLEAEKNIKLFVMPREFGSGLLVAAMADKSIKVHYVLRRSVRQQKDPDALPTKKVMLDALLVRARSYVARITQSGGSQA